MGRAAAAAAMAGHTRRARAPIRPGDRQRRHLSRRQAGGAVGLRVGGGLVLAVEDGFALLDPDWQRLEQVAVVERAGPRARFNDGKCDPAGRVLAGTMAYDLTSGAGFLCRLDPDRSVTMLLDAVTLSNGLAWTADGATMYYIDMPTQGVDAFDYDIEAGRMTGRRRLVDIPAGAGRRTA
jgi:sugar lactone lactonase YvrE